MFLLMIYLLCQDQLEMLYMEEKAKLFLTMI